MHRRIRFWIALAILCAMVFEPAVPIYRAYAGSPADVDVNLPIAEIEGLIQQLQDAANQIVGEAGVQIRETIRELSDQLAQRIDQIKNAAKEIIKEAVDQIRALLNDLIKQARALLQQVQQMIHDAIQCINQVLAERIAQITDAIHDLITQVGDTIKSAVDRIYVRSSQLIDTGTNRVAVMVNSTVSIIAKIVLIILGFVVLFWLIRALWKGTFPKVPAIRFGIPAVALLLVGGCIYLIASPSALGKILGTSVPIPKWENACENGNRLYTQFIGLRNDNAPPQALKAVGDSALEQLNWCLYASVSPQIGSATQTTIDQITAVLYPPPAPPPSTTPTASPCASQGGGMSIHPGWVGKFSLAKVGVITKLRATNVLRSTTLVAVTDSGAYYAKVRSVARVNPAFFHLQPH